MVVLHTRGRPIRAPWPAHCRLNGVDLPLALLAKNGTRLVGSVPPDQGAVAPTEFGEQAKNPAFGAPYAIRDLTRGMGQRRARQGPNGRYWYTLNARCRSGRGLLGPDLTTYTPATKDATVGVTRWFEIGGRLFALNGRYALSGGTDGTGWTVSKDFGVDKSAVDAIVAQDNHGSATRYALVAMGDSENFYYFDGATASTTWTQTTGADAMKARAWAVDADTLYRADDANRLNTCDLNANILLAANWASATRRIGTYDQAVTRMEINAAGSLLMYKADGPYSLQPDGDVTQLFARLQFPAASTNGEALGSFGNDSYVTYGFSTFRLSADGGLTPVGPELLKDNGSEVKGYVTAMVRTDFFLLAGLYNPDTGASYLLEYTGELVADEAGRAEPVWHGSIIAAQTGKKITSLHTSTIGAASGHKMAYIGFSDGTLAKYTLACTPDPADCTAERFSTSAGTIYHSRAYLVYPSERKALLSATGEGDNLSSATYATLLYRTSGIAAYTTMATAFDAGERKIVNFPTSTSCVYLDTAMRLTTTANTASPQVSGLSFLYQTRPVPQEAMQINVPAADGLRKRDGTPYRWGTEEIATFLDGLSGSSSAVPFIDPDGNSHTVFVKAPQRVNAWDAETKKPTDAYQVLLIEQAPTLAFGMLRNLNQLTLGQWETYLLVQLEDV